MTYGAGGSTRARTIGLVSQIKNEVGIEAVAHLTCVGHTKDEIRDVLNDLERAGVENILALRGDPPKGQTAFVPVANGFRFAAELVGFIKQNFPFCVGVAGYPEKHLEAASTADDLVHFKSKVDAGADFAVTQLFFDNADYFAYVERVRAAGLRIPVVAGIMPITDVEQVKRFTVMCGAKIPDALLEKLEAAGGDKERAVEIGIQHATDQCRDLLSRGAPGIHFYTLNKSHATREIFRRLKASPRFA
jgi:methylenetetrahydrofolate reductase (NADPH)